MHYSREQFAKMFEDQYQSHREECDKELLRVTSRLMRAHLQGRSTFDVGKNPALKIISVNEAYDQGFFEATVGAVYAFNNCLCERTATARIRFKSKNDPSTPKQYTMRKITDLANSLAPALARAIPTAAQTYDELSKVFSKILIANEPDFAAWVDEFSKANHNKIEKETAKALNDTLSAASKSKYAPEKCLKASIRNLEIAFRGKERYTAVIELAFELYYSKGHKYSITKTIEVQPPLPTILESKEKCYGALKEEISKALFKFEKDFTKKTPAFITFDSEPASKKFFSAIKRYTKPTPYITYVRPSIFLKAPSSPFIIWGDAVLLANGTPANILEMTNTEWNRYIKSVNTPYSIEKTDTPKNVFEMAQFVEQANKLYKDSKHADFLKSNPISFRLSKSNLFYSYMGIEFKASEIKPEELSVKDWLTHIPEEYVKALQEEMERKRTCEQKIAELNLGPLELAVLKYVYKEQRTWYSDISMNLDITPEFTKVSIGNALTAVAKKSIKIAGKNEKLLDSQWCYSRKRKCDYLLYTPNPKIPPETVERAKARAYSKEDIQNMVPYSREKWCQQLCTNAQTKEELWETLQILEGLPKTILAQYAKEPNYQAFFAKFTDTDALYVKYLLQSLPGCKRIANTLFPE